MRSHAKLAGHAIHQQLIVFPLGLLATAVVFDILRAITGNTDFTIASYYMIAAGVLSGLLAAVFGAIDYVAIPSATRAKRIGMLHGLGNVVVTAAFAISWLLRGDQAGYVPTGLALTLSIGAGVLATVTGWLGGELVDRLAVGIDEEADLDTPASFETGVTLSRGGGRPVRA